MYVNTLADVSHAQTLLIDHNGGQGCNAAIQSPPAPVQNESTIPPKLYNPRPEIEYPYGMLHEGEKWVFIYKPRFPSFQQFTNGMIQAVRSLGII